MLDYNFTCLYDLSLLHMIYLVLHCIEWRLVSSFVFDYVKPYCLLSCLVSVSCMDLMSVNFESVLLFFSASLINLQWLHLCVLQLTGVEKCAGRLLTLCCYS
jgi:hypothetical protein